MHTVGGNAGEAAIAGRVNPASRPALDFENKRKPRDDAQR